MDWFSYMRGKYRIWWGLCPACNSDAPEMDTCEFCHGVGKFGGPSAFSGINGAINNAVKLNRKGRWKEKYKQGKTK